MADKNAITEVHTRLVLAEDLIAVFGVLPGDKPSQHSLLRKRFAALAALVHPDVAAHDARDIAGETYAKLVELRNTAKSAIDTLRYEKFVLDVQSPGASEFELTSPKGSYSFIDDVYREGDFSVLYRGARANDRGERLIAKVAREPTLNPWLEREATILARFVDAKKASPVASIGRYIPTLVDTFFVIGEKNRRLRVVVYKALPKGVVSVAEILAAFPKGVVPQQAAWVSRRVIAQVAAAESIGVVHSAIVPDHVLVGPETHEPVHIGWAHAIDDPKKTSMRVTHIIDRFTEYYPPEVFAKKIPDTRTDVYMAGMTVLKLFGGDMKKKSLSKEIPRTIASVVQKAIEHSPADRFHSGTQFLDEFTRVVRSEWGRTYRPLVMPTR